MYNVTVYETDGHVWATQSFDCLTKATDYRKLAFEYYDSMGRVVSLPYPK